jgi:hypothetical protein
MSTPTPAGRGRRERSGAMLLVVVAAVILIVVGVVALIALLHANPHPCPVIQGVVQPCHRH